MKRVPRPIAVFREPPGRPRQGRSGLAGLPNLGPKSIAWLEEAGIHSRADIERLGVLEVCRRIRTSGRPASVLLAYALEGALAGCHWNEIPAETKRWLRAEFARLRQAPRRP